jgi:hypothetical protein
MENVIPDTWDILEDSLEMTSGPEQTIWASEAFLFMDAWVTWNLL